MIEMLTCSALSESELAVLPGSQPGTAIRIRLLDGQENAVRLEQLAYSATIGWYVQKSFCVPKELLQELSLHLRKADCLTPRRRACYQDTAPLRLCPVTPAQADEPQRRKA